MNEPKESISIQKIVNQLENQLDGLQVQGWNWAHDYIIRRLEQEICKQGGCLDPYCIAMVEAVEIVKGNREVEE